MRRYHMMQIPAFAGSPDQEQSINEYHLQLYIYVPLEPSKGTSPQVTCLLCGSEILKTQNHKSWFINYMHNIARYNKYVTLATRSAVNTTTMTTDKMTKLIMILYYSLLRDFRSRWITCTGASQWR